MFDFSFGPVKEPPDRSYEIERNHVIDVQEAFWRGVGSALPLSHKTSECQWRIAEAVSKQRENARGLQGPRPHGSHFCAAMAISTVGEQYCRPDKGAEASAGQGSAKARQGAAAIGVAKIERKEFPKKKQ